MANLTNLIALTNELVPDAMKLARTRAKVSEIEKFVYFGEGPPDQAAVTVSALVGAPDVATVSDRAAAISPTRYNDALTKTVDYAPYRTHIQLTDVELNRLVARDELGEVLAEGLTRAWGKVITSVTGLLTGALDSTTIPNIGGTTDYLAAEHTHLDAGTYDNSATAALALAAVQAGLNKMAIEEQWTGEPTYNMPRFLISSNPVANAQVSLSQFGSADLDANAAAGLGSIVLPGMGNFWALSAGANRNGLRVDFRGRGAYGEGGQPWIGEPRQASNGQWLIPVGCDFAAYALTYMGIYVSNGTA